MSDVQPASLESLGRELRELRGRVERIETRILRWGALIVLGAEAARIFLAPLIELP